MTSKIVVNNIEADAGVSTVTFGSKISSTEFVGPVVGNVTGNLTGNVTSSGISTFSDTVNVGAGKSIRLYGATSGYTEIVAAAGSASTTFTLPANGGSASQYLQTDGAGVLSWQTVTIPAVPDVPLDWPGTAVEAGAGGITQITFDNIDADAKRITLQFYHCGLSDAGVTGSQLRLRAGSGGSIMTSNSYHYQVGYGTNADSTINSDHYRITPPPFTDAQHRWYGSLIIEKINFTDRWVIRGSCGSIGYVTNPPATTVGGFDLPGTLDRIQFYCPSSTFADGRINILVEG